MTKINNGGPAFPTESHPGSPIKGWHGMSLRDYFAGQALHGLCANQSYVTAIATDEELPEEDKINKLAEICYELADTMLNERLQAREQKGKSNEH